MSLTQGRFKENFLILEQVLERTWKYQKEGQEGFKAAQGWMCFADEPNFQQLCSLKSISVPRLWPKPSHPQKLHSADLISTQQHLWMSTKDLHMINSKNTCIPVWFRRRIIAVIWVWGRCDHHDIRTTPQIYRIGLLLNIVGCVEYLTGLDRINSACHDTDGLTVGWCERIMSVAIKFSAKQTSKQVVLQLGQEVLQNADEVVGCYPKSERQSKYENLLRKSLLT